MAFVFVEANWFVVVSTTTTHAAYYHVGIVVFAFARPHTISLVVVFAFARPHTTSTVIMIVL